ncbi:MAG: alpha/beta hydrolase [Jatrophihabitantaceae bacterium]
MLAPTIVLLHGQPDSSASFWSLRRALRERLPAVRVLAPDRPGYGANPAPATDYAGNVRWLHGWLRQVRAGPTILLGHSWAGGIAALLAGDPGAGTDLAGLVLLASVGPSCLLRIDPVLAAPVIGDAIAFATLRLGRPLIARRVASTIIGEQAPADRPYALASGMAMRSRPVWRSFLLEQRALICELPAINDSLGRITVPTQLINGEQDPVIPARTQDELNAAIPQASAHRVPGGHDLQLRQPVAVADLVAGFAAPLLGRP